MKKFKKLIATMLAVATCLAMSVPCFAASVPAKNAVRLKVGESYTIGDTTITIKRDERTPAQRAAARKTLLAESITRAQIGDRYYYVKAEEYAKAHLDDYADILIPVYDLNGNVIGQFVSNATT